MKNKYITMKGGKIDMNTAIKAGIALLLMIIAIMQIVGNVSAAQNSEAQIKKVNAYAIRENRAVEPTVVDVVENPSVVSHATVSPEVSAASTAFFNGRGFAISSDNSNGYAISLLILNVPEKAQSDSLKGKLMMKNANYGIQGISVSNGVIQFSIFQNDQKTPIGSFSGTLKNYADFSLITGKLILSDENFDLTAFSQKEANVIRKITPVATAVSTENVKSQQMIEIAPTQIRTAGNNAPNQIYVTPTIVERPKILGLFGVPFTETKVELRITDSNGKVISKKTVNANSNTEVNGYQIGVGSLADPNNIEVRVEMTGA